MELQKHIGIEPILDLQNVSDFPVERVVIPEINATRLMKPSQSTEVIKLEIEPEKQPLGIETCMAYIAIPTGICIWTIIALMIRFVFF